MSVPTSQVQSTIKRLGFLVGVAFFAVVPLQSQTVAPTALSFGSATLTLGMPIETVSIRLAEDYRFDDSTGVVWSKDGPPFTIQGSLRFDASKRLIQASRNVDSSGPSGVPTVEALYNALGQITAVNADGTRTCRCGVMLKEEDQPEGSSRVIVIFDGAHSIRIEAIHLNTSDPSLPLSATGITETIARQK